MSYHSYVTTKEEKSSSGSRCIESDIWNKLSVILILLLECKVLKKNMMYYSLFLLFSVKPSKTTTFHNYICLQQQLKNKNKYKTTTYVYNCKNK